MVVGSRKELQQLGSVGLQCWPRSSNYAFESCWLVEREPPELRGPISDEGGYARHPEKESSD